MADSYTSRGGMIKPEPGQSLNTWGQKLNDYNFDIADKGMWGFQTIAVTGDFSLTKTNGDSTSTQINKGLHLNGSPTADFTVTALSSEHSILWYNNTGKNATIKVSAGTGVTLADGQIALLGYNAALGDITLVSPNRIPGNAVIGGALQVGGKITNLTAGTAALDAINLTQFDNGIAAILTAGDGSLLVRVTDTTRKFLNSALSVDGTFITKSITNPLGNEVLALAGTGKFLNSATDTTAGYLSQKVVENGDSALIVQTNNAGGNETRAFSTRRIELEAFFLASS